MDLQTNYLNLYLRIAVTIGARCENKEPRDYEKIYCSISVMDTLKNVLSPSVSNANHSRKQRWNKSRSRNRRYLENKYRSERVTQFPRFRDSNRRGGNRTCNRLPTENIIPAGYRISALLSLSFPFSLPLSPFACLPFPLFLSHPRGEIQKLRNELSPTLARSRCYYATSRALFLIGPH